MRKSDDNNQHRTNELQSAIQTPCLSHLLAHKSQNYRSAPFQLHSLLRVHNRTALKVDVTLRRKRCGCMKGTEELVGRLRVSERDVSSAHQREDSCTCIFRNSMHFHSVVPVTAQNRCRPRSCVDPADDMPSPSLCRMTPNTKHTVLSRQRHSGLIADGLSAACTQYRNVNGFCTLLFLILL